MRRNRFVGRDLLPASNRAVAALLESRFVQEDSGLYVIFESRVVDWPRRSHVEPFTVARHDYDREGPEAGMPREVVDCLRGAGWERLMWMPVEVAHGALDRYVHELQHYRQLIGAESLSKARRFLSRLRHEGFIPRIKTECDPREFDADVAAFDAFETIHGSAALQDFVNREAVDLVMRSFYDRVLPLRERFKAEQA
jgi:hypothetical protein